MIHVFATPYQGFEQRIRGIIGKGLSVLVCCSGGWEGSSWFLGGGGAPRRV